MPGGHYAGLETCETAGWQALESLRYLAAVKSTALHFALGNPSR
jgi:hypothetical protein